MPLLGETGTDNLRDDMLGLLDDLNNNPQFSNSACRKFSKSNGAFIQVYIPKDGNDIYQITITSNGQMEWVRCNKFGELPPRRNRRYSFEETISYEDYEGIVDQIRDAKEAIAASRHREPPKKRQRIESANRPKEDEYNRPISNKMQQLFTALNDNPNYQSPICQKYANGQGCMLELIYPEGSDNIYAFYMDKNSPEIKYEKLTGFGGERIEGYSLETLPSGISNKLSSSIERAIDNQLIKIKQHGIGQRFAQAQRDTISPPPTGRYGGKPMDEIFEDILSFYSIGQDGRIANQLSNLHGTRHIAHVTALTDSLTHLYKKHSHGQPYERSMQEWDPELIKIMVAFHDASRINEYKDKDEFSSALLCLSYLLENNLCPPEQAIKAAACICMKDMDYKELHKLQQLLWNEKSLNNFVKQHIPPEKQEKVLSLVNPAAIQKARQCYRENPDKLIRFAEDIKHQYPRIILKDADTVEIQRVRPPQEYKEYYAQYYKYFKNSHAINDFRELQKSFGEYTWERQHSHNARDHHHDFSQHLNAAHRAIPKHLRAPSRQQEQDRKRSYSSLPQ